MSTEKLASRYCNCLEEVKARLALVHSIAEGNFTAGSEIFNYEVVAVNLRKTLELIAFGSLSANKDVYAAAYANFAEHWNAKRLLNKLEQLHPDFFPKPVRYKVLQEGPPRHLHFEPLSDGFLTRDEFVELYDLCSQAIHARNPFAQGTVINFRHSVLQWVSRIELLLSLHYMRLAGTPQLWIVELSAPGDSLAHAYIANPSSDSQA